MTIGEISNRSVVTAEQGDTIQQIANRMRVMHVGDVVVVESRAGRLAPVGIITDRDIVVGIVAGTPERAGVLQAGDVMTRDLVTAREHETIESALAKMEEHGIRRLPIVDADGSLTGIVTLDDLLEHLNEQQAGLVRLVAHEQRLEKRQRV